MKVLMNVVVVLLVALLLPKAALPSGRLFKSISEAREMDFVEFNKNMLDFIANGDSNLLRFIHAVEDVVEEGSKQRDPDFFCGLYDIWKQRLLVEATIAGGGIINQHRFTVDYEGRSYKATLLNALLMRMNKVKSGWRLKPLILDLIRAGADVNIPTTRINFYPIHYALMLGDSGVIDAIIQAGARLDVVRYGLATHSSGKRNVIEIPLIFDAAEYGSVAALRAIIDARTWEIDLRNQRGYTPLIIALQHGHYDFIKAALETDADPNVLDNDGLPPLVHAAIHMHLYRDSDPLAITKLLVELGARANYFVRGKDRVTMFFASNSAPEDV